MPKYEDEIFFNMKNCVLLVIVFTNFIHCSDLNTSDDYPTCPFKLSRRKRELPEYTRWRANLESTQEFIVKVLDDDLTTPNTKKVIAVNIQPIMKGGEKIIIGGVMIPKPTAASSVSDIPKDYTRFVPPTTVVTRVDGELYLAPVAQPLPDIKKVLPVPPRGRHPQRDESPPAGPQFLPRATAAAWQYAPITPVGFTRRTTMTPVTPLLNLHSLRHSSPMPTRTSPFGDVLIPTRTTSEYDELRRYQQFEDDNDLFATRTTFVPQYEPQRTSLVYDTTPAKEFGMLFTKKTTFADDNELHQDRKPDNVDADATYHMMFYNDEEEGSSKKTEKESDESYEDKMHDNETDASDVSTQNRNLRRFSAKFDYDAQDNLENITSSSSASRTTSIETVTKLTLRDIMRDKRRPICSMLKLRQLNFNSPRTLPEIVSQLKQWADDSPVAKWIDITEGNFTAMENPIYMMIVDDPSSGQIVTAKQTVMIVAGIQGRDHHAVAAAMYVLYQLIERSEAHADLLTKYRFWVIPVFNPDGYDYSMTFPHRREWTKNLRQSWDVCKGRDACRSCESYGLRCTIQPCYGVNIDRNFEYQWIPAEELRSEHPCGSLYAGSRQLSEAETRALTRFLHDQRTPIFTFIAFKEGDVLGIMYPYSHTKKRRAFDHIYRQRASRAAAAAYSISGRPYVAGQTSEFLPLYAGGIEDWVDSHLGIDNTYTIFMFRPSDTYNSKLITERVVHEAYAAMDTLVLQSVETLGPPLVTITRLKSSAMSKAIGLSTAIIFVILNFYLNTFDTWRVV